MKEDPIAIYAKKLKDELNRDGFNPDERINWLDELIATYSTCIEDRIHDLDRRVESLEKIFEETTIVK